MHECLPDLHPHGGCGPLEQKSWWQNLFQEMSVFVEESLSGDASKPALVRMLEGVGATQAAGSGSALSGGKQHEMEILRQEFAQKLEEKHVSRTSFSEPAPLQCSKVIL